MGSKNLLLVVILAVALCFSCKSGPDKTENEAPVEKPASNDSKTEVVGFDPTRVSQAQYASTRDEVRSFIENLNQIIRSRNYEAWKAVYRLNISRKFHLKKTFRIYPRCRR